MNNNKISKKVQFLYNYNNNIYLHFLLNLCIQSSKFNFNEVKPSALDDDIEEFLPYRRRVQMCWLNLAISIYNHRFQKFKVQDFQIL